MNRKISKSQKGGEKLMPTKRQLFEENETLRDILEDLKTRLNDLDSDDDSEDDSDESEEENDDDE